MFKRSRVQAPAWKVRLDTARSLVAEHGDLLLSAPHVDFARLEAALEQANDDLSRLDTALQAFDPAVIGDELKAALRARPSPTAPDTELIAALRQRHEMVHTLRNRRDDIDTGIERTLVDLEAYSAKTIELSFVAGRRDAGALDAHLERLNRDVDSLVKAHEQLSAS